MPTDDADPFADIEVTLKKAGAALRGAGVPFLLGGSLASWARGGPETRHDLDLMIRPEDTETAVRALEQAGMRPEDPPEEWLLQGRGGGAPRGPVFPPQGQAPTPAGVPPGEGPPP